MQPSPDFQRLDAEFARRQRLSAAYRLAQYRIAASFSQHLEGAGEGPSENDFDELAVLMTRTQNADIRYLRLLSRVASQVTARARCRGIV